jgi:hypothetical protein
MANAVEMIAHCLFHQTPPWQRGLRCDRCGTLMREAVAVWYCPECLSARRPDPCPICTEQIWR